MKHLTGKDYVIIGLVFIFLLVSTPLFGLLDETSLEGSLPAAATLLSGLSFMLSIPINIITMPLRSSSAVDINLISWLSAIFYSVILALVLSKLNKKKIDRKV